MGDKWGYKLVLSSVMQAALTWRGSLITEVCTNWRCWPAGVVWGKSLVRAGHAW